MRTLLTLGLLGLVAAGAGILTIHFAADFELAASSSPGSIGAPIASVGKFSFVGAPDLFTVVADGSDNQKLEIGPNDGNEDAILHADLDPSADEVTVDIKLELRAFEFFDDLVIRVADENDTGMIDMTFGREGKVRIKNRSETLPGGLGDTFRVHLRIRDPVMASPSFSMVVTGPEGKVTLKGPLPEAEGAIHSLSFVRRSGTEGRWRIDNVYVTSVVKSPWSIWANFLHVSD